MKNSFLYRLDGSLLRVAPRVLALAFAAIAAHAMLACGDASNAGNANTDVRDTISGIPDDGDGAGEASDATDEDALEAIDARDVRPGDVFDASEIADTTDDGSLVRCVNDEECDGGRCIHLIPGQDGFCFERCVSTETCPEGSECLGLASSGVDLEQVCVPLDLCIDQDGDGWGVGPGCRGPDCDDTNPDVNFGAPEVCDGIDNNCDGQIDVDTRDSGRPCETGHSGVCNEGVTVCARAALTCQSVTGPSDEVCNGLDDNCNGVIDENAVDAPYWYRDADGDRFGDPDVSTRACVRPEGYVEDNTDCDDTNRFVNPAAMEVCDGQDNDCDGIVDNVDPSQIRVYYRDRDGDGYGDAETAIESCAPLEGYVTRGGDCDDTDPAVHPAAIEVCDGIDNNCDGQIDPPSSFDAADWYLDADGDTYGNPAVTMRACSAPDGWVGRAGDCDDTDASVNPDAEEVCDGIDNNCDGRIDPPSSIDATVWYEDADGDTYGNSDVTVRACTAPEGWVERGGDCDDTDASVNPDAEEVCDGIDNNCDGQVDPPTSVDARVWYRDADGDGFGTPLDTIRACTQPVGYVDNFLDCNDLDSDIHPDAVEVCDGIDNNCDGIVDGPGALGSNPYWRDADGDGFGDPADMVMACAAPPGYVSNDRDCDDTNPFVSPVATEVCNGIDDNCDGNVDVGAVDAPTWYRDADGDGFGDPNVSTRACTQPAGYVADNRDCDDSNSNINPGAPEICNGIDDNCNGNIDEGVTLPFWPDADGDGYGNRDALPVYACTAPHGHVGNNLDCRDDIARINPAAAEVCDGWDNNCNGVVDSGTCPSQCSGHSWGGRGYMVCRENGLTRHVAQARCAAGANQMDLVQIDSLDENDFVWSTANDRWGSGWGHMWIGLNDVAEPGVYRWQNGSVATFHFWAPGEPNNHGGREDCADMTRSSGGRWNDVGCGRQRNEFFCRWR